MNKNITNYNHKGQYHGYQEWYYMRTIMKLRCRGNYKNDKPVGYSEWHGVEKTRFYIR